MNKTRFIHFRNYNHIALTIATQHLEGCEHDCYLVGMALAHKNDNGNKAMGRRMSEDFIDQALDLIDLVYSQPNQNIFGHNGCYIVRGRENVKLIMRYLRMIERCESNARKNSVFHQAFFTLHALFGRKIINWDGQDIKKAEVQLDKFIKDMWVDEKGVLRIVPVNNLNKTGIFIETSAIDVTFDHITC